MKKNVYKIFDNSTNNWKTYNNLYFSQFVFQNNTSIYNNLKMLLNLNIKCNFVLKMINKDIYVSKQRRLNKNKNSIIIKNLKHLKNCINLLDDYQTISYQNHENDFYNNKD